MFNTLVTSVLGPLTLNALASPLSIWRVCEPWRFLSHIAHISGGEVKDSRNPLDEVPPKQGLKHPGGVVYF